MASGAPMTVSAAPSDGARAACSIESPPTAWMGEHGFSGVPVALYGADLLMCSIAFYLLLRTLIAAEGRTSKLAVAVGRDAKGKLSLVANALGVALAFPAPRLAYAMYVAVAIVWLVPDRRIERALRR